MARIGFVGASGLMGHGMARHLLAHRHVPSVVGEAVHQSLALASALGHGRKFVPSLVEAQEQLSGARLVPRQG